MHLCANKLIAKSNPKLCRDPLKAPSSPLYTKPVPYTRRVSNSSCNGSHLVKRGQPFFSWRPTVNENGCAHTHDADHKNAVGVEIKQERRHDARNNDRHRSRKRLPNIVGVLDYHGNHQPSNRLQRNNPYDNPVVSVEEPVRGHV